MQLVCLTPLPLEAITQGLSSLCLCVHFLELDNRDSKALWGARAIIFFSVILLEQRLDSPYLRVAKMTAGAKETVYVTLTVSVIWKTWLQFKSTYLLSLSIFRLLHITKDIYKLSKVSLTILSFTVFNAREEISSLPLLPPAKFQLLSLLSPVPLRALFVVGIFSPYRELEYNFCIIFP